MTLIHIAAKNVKQNRQRYVAYIASMAFTIMVYFMYMSLVNHPQLTTNFRGASGVKIALNGSAIVIAAFTFIFLAFSSSAFLRGRKKEFGLLTLLGMPKRKISALIIWENIFVGIMALGFGLSLGIIFQKLFFMAISAILRLPNPLGFSLAKNTVINTISIFGALFMAVAIFSLREVLKASVADLIKAGKKPKAAPTFSKFKAFLGLFLIVLGYTLASLPLPQIIPLLVIPVIAITCIGTYLAMREASVAILSLLRKNKSVFYKSGPFLNISQLSYKMKDNYRTMSAVAILIAVILSALGSVYTIYAISEQMTLESSPNNYELAGTIDLASYAKQMEAIFQAEDVDVIKSEIIGLNGRLALEQRKVVVFPYSCYQESLPKLKKSELKDNEVIITGDYNFFSMDQAQREEDTLVVNEVNYPIQIVASYSNSLINWGNFGYLQVVVSDELYNALANNVKEKIHYIFWQAEKWKSIQAIKAARRIKNEVKLPQVVKREATKVSINTSPDGYESTRVTFGVAIFIGFFVSLVFFAACCSLLYFRLFTDLDEDRKYYQRLKELGLSTKEMKGITFKQILVIFLIPYGLGLLHTTFALYALGTIVGRTVLQHGIVIALLYLVLYMLYFFTTFSVYWKSLNRA